MSVQPTPATSSSHCLLSTWQHNVVDVFYEEISETNFGIKLTNKVEQNIWKVSIKFSFYVVPKYFLNFSVTNIFIYQFMRRTLKKYEFIAQILFYNFN